MNRLLRTLLRSTAVAALLLWGGCLTVREPAPAGSAWLGGPAWSDAELRQHLRFFHTPATMEAAGRLLAHAAAVDYVAARLENFGLQPVYAGRFRVPYPAIPDTVLGTATGLAAAPPVNLLGYLPGAHPVLARDLVIVCTDLDAPALSAQESERHASPRSDVGVAALLEVARYYGRLSQFWDVPERTLLLAVWSGRTRDRAGLRSYLRHPTWDPSRIRAVLYLGLDPADEPDVRALLADYDIPLYAISFPEEPAAETAGAPTPDARPPTPVEQALREARRLAEDAHHLVLREATGDGPFVPVQADTLRVPTERTS